MRAERGVQRLLTVAFPAVGPAAAEFMRSYQQSHSPGSRASVQPHFTLVFSSASIPQKEYLAHVTAVASLTNPIRFVCRYAMLGADDEDERAYVFLVPEEGYAAISRLHDAMYAGPLASRLRLDLPYVPHITIGVSGDRRHAKSLCDQLNAEGVCIHGSITEVTVGCVRDAEFQSLSVYRLGGGE